MDIIEELPRRSERLKVIREAKAEVGRCASKRHAAEQNAYEETCSKREQKEHKTGKKPRGKEPKPPQVSVRILLLPQVLHFIIALANY